MTAEQIVILATSLVGSSAVVLGPILLYLVKMKAEGGEALDRVKTENSKDHAKVGASVDVLAMQVAELTKLTVEATAELKAHTKWEESQKYASMDQIEKLIQSVQNVQLDVADVKSAQGE